MSLATHFDVLRNLGTIPTARYAFQRLRNRFSTPELFTLESRYARYPVWCRGGTSDEDVFGQIFSHREYQCLDHVEDAELIIVWGAIFGFSAAYFLSQHPLAHLIAVEPDEGNFTAMQRNLCLFGPRANCVRAGVWWREAGLKVIDSPYAGDGREWAFGIREVTDEEAPDVMATDIGTLAARYSHKRISILKIDIEGSEEEIFDHPCPWLDKVDNLVIETHGPQCEANVRRTCAEHGFTITRFNDELLVGVR